MSGPVQTARMLNAHCRSCRHHKVAFLRDGVEVFRLQRFPSPHKAQEAIDDWKRGWSMGQMAEKWSHYG